MRKYCLVLLCCLRDRHQLQTSVKDNKQYPFFISVLLTVLDIITFALGLTMILNMFLSNSFFFFQKSCRTRKLRTINTIPIKPTMVLNAAISVFRLKS